MKSFAFVTSVTATQPSFQDWASQYGLNGNDQTLEMKYNANVKLIDDLNAADNGAIFAVNQFAGMTFDEFANTMLNAKPGSWSNTSVPHLGFLPVQKVQVSDVDWDVTPVKDQGQCGSCWAFGTLGAVEAVYKQSTGTTVNLAEQQLVDCSTQNSGCNGGRPDWAMDYLEGKDIYTTASYPYTASDGTCKTGTASGVQITGYNTVTKSDAGLASALNNGAATVLVYADSSFQFYSSGVLTSPPTTCSLNHAVLATGYGSNYWKIKNSWGTSWGEAGYIRFERTTAGCGPFGLFYDYPTVPEVSGAPTPVPVPPTPVPAPTPVPVPTPSPSDCEDIEDHYYCDYVVNQGWCGDIGSDCLLSCDCCDDHSKCGQAPAETVARVKQLLNIVV